MAEQLDERLDLALKQIREDETLTAGLTDQGAAAVLGWVERELRAASVVDQQSLARRAEELRRAVKQVARRYGDDPSALIAAAKAAAPSPSSAPASSSAVVANVTEPLSPPPVPPPGSAPAFEKTAARRVRPRPTRPPRPRRRRSWMP